MTSPPLSASPDSLSVAALGESEGIFRSLFENMYDPILLLTDGLFVDCNAATLRLLGYASKAEFLNRRPAEISPPLQPDGRASQDKAMEMMSTALREGYNRFEWIHTRADGSDVPVEVTLTPITVGGKVILHTLWRDITERKRTEDALRGSEERLRTLIEQSPLGIAFSRDGITLDANPVYLRMFGFERASELSGRPLIEQIAPQCRAEIIERLQRRMRGEAVESTYETTGLRKDGAQFPFMVSSSRIVLPDGPMTIAFFIDISERKEAEAVRESLEAQLREAQKMEAIGTLAGGIAHDFNNMLAAILGNAELARQDAEANPLALESLGEIRKAALRAKDLVQQILAFSRRQPTVRRVLALSATAEQTARLMRATLPAQIVVKCSSAADVPAVLADPIQMEQVLANLITNSAQAMEGLPGRIEIRVEGVTLDGVAAPIAPGLRPGRYARVSVSDTGHGMDAATLERIFEPFFTTKQVGERIGLGLSVVHGIMRAHDGAIRAHSELGSGSRFELYLPQTQSPLATEEPKDAGGAGGSGQHVLYIDDDEAMVFLVKRMLDRLGYRVSGFTDQREGLAALRADPHAFDLAVTDYNMPGMSGLDVARAIRDIRPDLPVAMASGYITDELREQAPGAGVRDLIFKPNTVEEFCSAVQRLVLRHAG